MALKPLVRDVGIRAQLQSIPNVRFSTAGGEALFSLSGALTAAAQSEKKREDEEDKVRGAKEGAEAALAQNIQVNGKPIPSFVRVEGTGAFEKAFNRSQFNVYATRLEDVTRRQAARLALEHRNDPVGMEQAMTSFVTGIASTVPAEHRADFVNKSGNFIRPYVKSAWDDLHQAQEDDNEASLNALTESQLLDAHRFGIDIGSGSTAAADGALALGDIFKSFVDKVANAVDGVDYTVGEALEDIQAYSSSISKAAVTGMFDGAKNKNAMFGKFLRGELEVELPITDAEGNVTIQKQNLATVLSAKDADTLRTYMKTRIDGLYTQRQRARQETGDAADFSNRLALGRLARTGDRASFDQIMSNPNSTHQDVTTAQELMRDAPFNSQPEYFSAMKNAILLGTVTDDSELDMSQLSQPDRDALLSLIDEQNEDSHFTKNVQYKSAEDTLKTRILEQVNTQVQFRLVAPRQATGTRQALASRFILSLKKKAQETQDDGGIIGRNAGGEVFQEVDAPGQPGGKVTRFDPTAWVDQTIGIYDRRVKGITEQLAPLRQEARDLGTKIAQSDNRNERNNLTTQLERVQKNIRNLKTQMKTLALEELVEDLD